MTGLIAGLGLAFFGIQEDDLDGVLERQQKLRTLCAAVVPAYVFFPNGSGVSISADGWVLTNHHVIGEGKGFRVYLAGGRMFFGDVVGFDPLGDISLVKLRSAKDLPFLELADSDALRVGEPVIAVGNPFLLGTESREPTVTFGVVSALHRYQDWYMDAIQTDAQINPGNSGGPLINMDGRVIGINGRIEVRRFMNRVNSGIGYAIPSNQIRRYLKRFKEGGRVRHGYLEGVTVGECGDDRYDRTGEYGDGVFIAGIEEGGAADTAGLKEGDIVVEVEGHRVINLNRFHGIVGTFPAGDRVQLKFRRWVDSDWRVQETRVYLGDPQKTVSNAVATVDLGFRPNPDFTDLGVEVDEIAEEGPAAKAGLRVGDVIRKVGIKRIRSIADLDDALRSKKSGEAVVLAVRRAEDELTVTLTLGERER